MLNFELDETIIIGIELFKSNGLTNEIISLVVVIEGFKNKLFGYKYPM